MPYTTLDLTNLGLDQNKTYPIVSLNIFDNLEDITLNNKTTSNFKYTLELYKEYLQFLKDIRKTTRDKVLTSLKNEEVINNQILESEDFLDISLYHENHHSIAINYLLKRTFTENKPLSNQMIAKSYEILMRGTSSEKEYHEIFRKNNNIFVGYDEQDERVVQYLPISYEDIEWALAYFTAYYNKPATKEEDLFIRPFTIHGLIAALQLFNDGNTRFSRTLQHLKLFTITNKLLDNSITSPVLYFSKTYLPYRNEYRTLIAKIASNPSIDNWNEWLNFNLRRVQDQIYLNENNISLTLKI